uniref:Uncharacterized protein n=1 Tax=Rhizophora mucronata TaxID=61149 RepID=A0A2P2MZ36_RHIMU
MLTVVIVLFSFARSNFAQ